MKQDVTARNEMTKQSIFEIASLMLAMTLLIIISLLFLIACPVKNISDWQNGINGSIQNQSKEQSIDSEKAIIEGTVILKDGEEIDSRSIGATIYIEGTNISTKTDTTGQFSLPDASTEKTFYIVGKKINKGTVFKARTEVKKILRTQKSFKVGNLLLKNTGSIAGNMLLKQQTDFNNINVFLNATSMVTKTDANGYFIIDELAEGDYYVTASKLGYITQTTKEAVKVVSGETTLVGNIILELDTKINEYGKITGKIIDNNNKPIPAVVISLIDSKLMQIYATVTDETGNYSLDSIDVMNDKNFQLFVHKTHYNLVIDKISIEKAQNLNKNFTLTTAEVTYGRLNLTILGCNNQPLRDAINIKISEYNNNVAVINTGTQSQFSNIYPGKYILEISSPKSGINKKIFNIDNIKVGYDKQAGDLVDLTININEECKSEIENIVFDGMNVVNDKLKIIVTPVNSTSSPALADLTKNSFKIVNLKISDHAGITNQLNANIDNIEINQPDLISVFNTVLAIDTNEALKTDDPNEVYKTAIKSFINNTGINDLTAVYEMGNSARLLQNFTNQHDLLNTSINNIAKSNKSLIYTSLLDIMKNKLLFPPLSDPIKPSNRNIIVFTNGALNADDKNSEELVIQKALSLNIPVNVINLESQNKDINITGLQKLASKTGGIFIHAFDSSELKQIFQKFVYTIKGNIGINTDLNLTNFQKRQKYIITCVIETKLPNGNIIPLVAKGVIYIP